MKKVLKNIFKSISTVCLILVVLYTFLYALLNLQNNIAKEKYKQYTSSHEKSHLTVEEISEVYSRPQVVYGTIPSPLGYGAIHQVLVGSVIIGSIIGVAISVNEFSKKSKIVTYIATYIIVVIGFFIISRAMFGVTNYAFGMDTIFDFGESLVIYTIVFALAMVVNRIYRKRQSNLLNRELKSTVES